ncbi:MAG: DUF5663 domain-containing protein [Patescibacteria group bacterium]
MLNKDLLSENIIALLGLESLPEEEKKALIDKMTDLVMKRVMLRLMNEMKAEDSALMSEMESRPEEVLAFIAEKVPNFDEIMKEEIVRVKEEMLSATEQE